MSKTTRCAGCKSLRRRCSKDCVLAPYFPANDPQRFSCVHKIFGASNVTKNLELLPEYARSDAANCMTFEARARIEDPVYGCTGMIFKLQQQIIQIQCEVEKIQGEITAHKAREDIFQHELLQQSYSPSTILHDCEEQNVFQLNDLQ